MTPWISAALQAMTTSSTLVCGCAMIRLSYKVPEKEDRYNSGG